MSDDVFALPAVDCWRCPCSSEKRHPRSELTPVATYVSLLERECPFCGRHYRPEYRQPPEREEAER
jgi:hypothetical protein